MEMTIKQLADELGVSKTTISKVVSGLGFNGKLHKEEEKSQISQTLQTNEEEKIQISLLEKQNAILQEQLSILNKQLWVKDEQIKLLQEQLIAKDVQIGQVTTAMESMATALTAAQALHAGTIQKQLTDHSEIADSTSDYQEQPKQKQSFFSRLFSK